VKQARALVAVHVILLLLVPGSWGRWIPGAFLFTACVGLLFLFNRRVFAKANGAANNTVGLLSVVRRVTCASLQQSVAAAVLRIAWIAFNMLH
jgi:hypothetical protein